MRALINAVGNEEIVVLRRCEHEGTWSKALQTLCDLQTHVTEMITLEQQKAPVTAQVC